MLGPCGIKFRKRASKSKWPCNHGNRFWNRYGPIQSGSRAEHRKSIGRIDDSLADSHTLPAANYDLVVDAEIVDDGDELTATMRSRARVESDDGL